MKNKNDKYVKNKNIVCIKSTYIIQYDFLFIFVDKIYFKLFWYYYEIDFKSFQFYKVWI